MAPPPGRHPAYIPLYLDDFIVVGATGSAEFAAAMTNLEQACTYVGMPITKHKKDGPTHCLTFLGIELDTVASQLRIPTDKLQ